jgi:hypothetical protein
MVPAMQWMWWLLGHVLPAWPKLPVLLMTVVSVGSIGAASGAMGILAGRTVGWLVAAMLVVHPAHAAWSSSAYNVMIPHFFASVAMLAVALSVRRDPEDSSLRWLCATSLVLSVATRMDSGTVGLLVVMWALTHRPAGSTLKKQLRSWVGPGVGTLVMAAACIWPMLWPGSLPGSGERALSLAINLTFFEPYFPRLGALGLCVGLVAAVIAVRRRPETAVPLLLAIISHHVLMATFDDFGERHTLVVAPFIAGLFGYAVVWSPRIGPWLFGTGMVVAMVGLQDQASRYYGSETDFISVLDSPPWADLPRLDLAQARDPDCGWVAEDARVAANPVVSHFNILRPAEEAEHRGSSGCLQWCADIQDWRWSSRGVRDRALRLAHLFELSPSHVVADPSTGYACLVMDVGHRIQLNPWSDDGIHPSASRSDHPVP